uniref:Magnesium and cobalt efflux protein CorC n=1 Tax=Candidatus Kentrum sp. FM TaxID=2126340 RepID=A0A450W232_9GAMM|nr:MAG: magnesium and cobalt transporter [Candidatus Kentron sp. FM]VFJ56078.1 MAG: magnesium and cobalt transporter [Candidatus Kentron sp. FM]VFK11128.1 MAG: magnesium and cobalt transporter [Candidatus Kentron sp. FM]
MTNGIGDVGPMTNMIDDKPLPRFESRSWLWRLKKALFGVGGEPRDREQLIAILRDAESDNLLDAETLGMIEGVLQVTELQVRHIMVARARMVVVEEGRSPEEFISIVTDSAHSRFPIIGGSRDEIQGILLAKDLLGYFASKDRREFDIRDIMRPAIFIPESKRLNVLLREFRASRNHMAIVVDEYGGVSGLITIEDVLEQIVGDIDDEHDVDDAWYIRAQSDNEYTLKALTPIEEFNEYFHTAFSDREFDTIGGVVVNAFGYLPRRGETKKVGGIEFTVLQTSKRRVSLFKLRF